MTPYRGETAVSVAAPARITRYDAGDSARHFAPGDFILTHGDDVVSRAIRIGQRLRFRGEERRYAYWNHAALIVAKDGDLIEALARGVVRRNLDAYTAREYHVVQIAATAEDRDEAVTFAETVLAVGSRYGYLAIASIALNLLTDSRLTFFVDGQYICSALVARALERTQARFDLDPMRVTPAHLAKYYQVAAL
jgi:uncharacterized protein YycO